MESLHGKELRPLGNSQPGTVPTSHHMSEPGSSVLQPRSSLSVTEAPLNSLAAIPAMCSWVLNPQKPPEITNVYCFKLLPEGVVCYTVIVSVLPAEELEFWRPAQCFKFRLHPSLSK